MPGWKIKDVGVYLGAEFSHFIQYVGEVLAVFLLQHWSPSGPRHDVDTMAAACGHVDRTT